MQNVKGSTTDLMYSNIAVTLIEQSHVAKVICLKIVNLKTQAKSTREITQLQEKIAFNK